MASYVDSEILKVNLNQERTKDGTRMKLLKSPQGEDFLDKFDGCKTFEERVSLARIPFEWTPTRAETLEKYQKNACASQALRQRGNGKFKTNDFEDALECYNLAVMFAKTTDEELGLAYANRSAVLVEMRDYEGALKDVELARNHNYPVALTHKLDNRRSRCNDLILKRNQDDASTEREKRKLLRIREEMLKIDANPLMPTAASCVKMKHDGIIGRHLIVGQDVPAATVLIVENPYAALLYDELKWETKHCHYCWRKIRRGIPCYGCVFVIYCDEACKLKAYQEYHQWECTCLPQLHCDSTPKDILLAFRIICKVGPEELCRLFNTRDPKFFNQSGFYGTDENSRYESDYLSVYHLQAASKHLEFGERFSNTHTALLWMDVLDTETNFFKGIRRSLASASADTEEQPQIFEDFKNFVAAIMLRHIETVPLNYSAMFELNGLENFSLSNYYNGELSQDQMFENISTAKRAEYGCGIYPVFSMLTHSCDGNTIRVSGASGGTCIVIAKRRIKAGETLFTNYGLHFACDSKEYRQSDLRERYYFDCRCLACELNWPLLTNMDSKKRFCCPSCTKKNHGCKESEKYEITGPNMACGECGQRYKEEDLNENFALNIKNYLNVLQLVFHSDPCDGLKQLGEAIEYFQYHLCPPNEHDDYMQMIFLTNLVIFILHYAETFY